MLDRAWIAQSVEQRIENPRVGGSIPSPGTKERTTAPPSFLILRPRPRKRFVCLLCACFV